MGRKKFVLVCNIPVADLLERDVPLQSMVVLFWDLVMEVIVMLEGMKHSSSAHYRVYNISNFCGDCRDTVMLLLEEEDVG